MPQGFIEIKSDRTSEGEKNEMKAAINIGNEVSEEAMNRIATAIEKVFRVGFETHAEQDTIQKALDVVERVAVVQNVTIQNCTLAGDTTVNTQKSTEEN